MHSVDEIEIAGGTIVSLSGGSGQPLIYLHHSISSQGWLPLHDTLAQGYEVHVPDMPGWGRSTRPEWARDVRDIAALMLAWIDAKGIQRPVVVGCGLGGWVAAELAVMMLSRMDQLVLVGAAGLQPRQGTIADQLVIDYNDYLRLGFQDQEMFDQVFGEDPPRETRQLLYDGREMTMRVTFKPWMFRRQLPHLLRNVETPAVVVWGSEDRIVPADCGRQYAEILPNARLEIIEDAGHFLDLERPEVLAGLIRAAALNSVA